MAESKDTPTAINQLLNEADQALVACRWTEARAKARAVLALDSNNGEAQSIMEAVAVHQLQARGSPKRP